MDIEEFYEQDERRRRSSEIEFGRDWKDAAGVRYELSWVADTGELYVMREPVVSGYEDPFGDMIANDIALGSVTVSVIGQIADHDRLEQALEGWTTAMNTPDSTQWLLEHLRSAGIASDRASDAAGGPGPAD